MVNPNPGCPLKWQPFSLTGNAEQILIVRLLS